MNKELTFYGKYNFAILSEIFSEETTMLILEKYEEDFWNYLDKLVF